MISRTVKIQLMVFALISFVGVAYSGFTFVGIRSLAGIQFAPEPYTVKMDLASSGGIFTNAQVTERGVPVGRVGSLRLIPNGVQVDLKINHDKKIPADATGQVSNLSAVGEQYVDLTPQADAGPYLHKNSVIPMSKTTVPVDDATLLLNLDKLVNSVDRQNLQTVIRELGTSFDGTGPDLQRLIDRGNALLASAQAALPQTLKLIDDGKTALNTQRAVSGDLKSFSHNLNLLSQQLVVSDPDIRRLLDNGVASAQTLQGVLQDNQKDLPTVLGNLVTLGQIGQARLPGVEQTFILYPLNVANGFLGARDTTGDGIAEAQFGAVTTSAPPVCTSGYGTTKQRSERKGNPNFGLGGPANVNTLCTAPDQAGQGSGQSQARGAATAPRPAGDNTGVRGGAVGTSNSGKPTYEFAGYDSSTRRFAGPNGKTYSLGTAGLDSTSFGPTSWQYLLVSSAAS